MADLPGLRGSPAHLDHPSCPIPLTGARNAQIRTAHALIGIEPTSAPIGGDARL